MSGRPWYCTGCGRPCDVDPARPSLDPRFALGRCPCSSDPTKVAHPVQAVPLQATALRIIDDRRSMRTYVRALRKETDGRPLSVPETAALAARRS